MKQWFKLKFVLFGGALGLIAILFSEKNTQGTPQAVKTIAKNLAIGIVTILATGLIIGLAQVWLPKS